MQFRFLQVCMTLALLPCAALARQSQDSTASSQILRLPGRTIEVVGLKRWTLGMLQDSLKAHGTPITSGACAATLRYKLGFADAAVINGGSPQPGGASYMLLTLVEPGDSARVKHRNLPIDTTEGRAEWKAAWTLARSRETQEAFRTGFSLYLAFRDSAATTWPQATRKDSVAIRSLWAFLKKHNTAADYRAALLALDSAPTIADRSAAIAILLNFPNEDRTWSAYANAMLESDGPLQMLGTAGLWALIGSGYKPSSWKVIAPQLHAVFNGTSHFMLFDAMRLVLTIKPDTALARDFLKDGGNLLLGFAGTQEPMFAGFALATLQVLSGRNYGEDVGKWRTWVASL